MSDTVERRVVRSGGMIYISWDAGRGRASYTVDCATAAVTDNANTSLSRHKAMLVAKILADHGERRLAERVSAAYCR